MANQQRSLYFLIASAIAIVVVLSLTSLTEARPPSVGNIFPDYSYGQMYGYEYDYDYPIKQGARGRRWAFPLDVQETRCPIGQRPHSSGIGCVSDAKEDDY